MDIQYWLYIIVGILYLLNQFRKKPEEQQTDLPDTNPEKPARGLNQPDARPAPQKVVSFEELLREITQGKEAASEPVETKAAPKYTDYDDEIKEEEAESLEEVNYDYRKRDKLYETYEDARTNAFVRPSLEETMKLSDTNMEYGRFKEFDKQIKVKSRYLEDLKDVEGLKKAFVMSEILKRKF